VANLTVFLQRLTNGLAAKTLGGLPDRELLRRFAARREQTAFEAIVRRHGPMVLRVCWRVLRQSQDAEDAFQATFLLLARNAGSVRTPDSLSSWLHGVAHRIALKARTQRALCRRHEALHVATAGLLADAGAQQLCSVLDEELSRLPEEWRLPLIFCYLEGRTQDEAAAQLGWSTRTFRRRLEEARAGLGRRLVRRGVASVLLLSDSAVSAPLPARLAASTAEAGARVAAGMSAAGIVSAKVLTLAEGVMDAMLKLKLSVTGLLIAGLLVACTLVPGLCGVPPSSAAQQQATQPRQTGVKTQLEPGARGTLLLARERDIVSLTPDGKQGAELSTPKDTRTGRQARLSPDGTRAVFVVSGGKPRGPDDDPDAPWPFQVIIRKLDATESKTVDFSGFGIDLCWAPDGKRVAVTKLGRDQSPTEAILLDPETAKKEPLDLPVGARLLDWSRDGKTFLVIYQKEGKFRLGLAAKGEKEARELLELRVRSATFAFGRFSPDGKKILFTDADPRQKDAYRWNMSSQPYMLNIASKKRHALAEFPENACCTGVTWSPDGKRVAYTWVQLHPELLKKDMLGAADDVQTEAFLIVADADGKNARTITSERANQAFGVILGSIDWR
jgi:RNA polymerase sigma factor (sigma-70 family)